MGDQTELVIGLVAAAGTDLGRVTDELRTELHEYGYSVDVVRLSDYLQDLPWAADFKDKPEDERMWLAMDAGTRLRTETDHGDALALWAISDIVAARERESTARVQDGQEEHPANLDRKAWILRSLKTPEEVATLRAVYGPRFVLVAAYSPEQRRNEDLGEQIRRSRGTKNRDEWMHQPEELIQRDRMKTSGKVRTLRARFIRLTSSSTPRHPRPCETTWSVPWKSCSGTRFARQLDMSSRSFRREVPPSGVPNPGGKLGPPSRPRRAP
jgi:hypothetical protein